MKLIGLLTRYRTGNDGPRPTRLTTISCELELWQKLLQGRGGEYADMADVPQKLAMEVTSLNKTDTPVYGVYIL
jgi:hypothetical protein